MPAAAGEVNTALNAITAAAAKKEKARFIGRSPQKKVRRNAQRGALTLRLTRKICPRISPNMT